MRQLTDRSKFLVTSLLVAIAACTSKAPDELPEARCARARDHMIDLRFAAATGIDVAAHKRAMAAAIGDDFASRCTAMTDDQVTCLLNAVDTPALAACGGGN